MRVSKGVPGFLMHIFFKASQPRERAMHTHYTCGHHVYSLFSSIPPEEVPGDKDGVLRKRAGIEAKQGRSDSIIIQN